MGPGWVYVNRGTARLLGQSMHTFAQQSNAAKARILTNRTGQDLAVASHQLDAAHGGSIGVISASRVSGAMSCSLGHVTAPKRMPT